MIWKMGVLPNITKWLDQRLTVFNNFFFQHYDNMLQRGYFHQAEYFHEVECTTPYNRFHFSWQVFL